MRCSLCIIIGSIPEESRASFAVALQDESALRYYASMYLDSMKKPDPTVIAEEVRRSQRASQRGTLISERCARLVESRCGGVPCGDDACTFCNLARDIREKSDEMYAERDLEIAEESLDELADRLIDEVCDEHRLFGALMREEQCRRQTWDLATSVPAKRGETA